MAGLASGVLSGLAAFGVLSLGGPVFIIGMLVSSAVLLVLSLNEDRLEPYQEWFARSYWGDHPELTLLKEELYPYPTALQERGAFRDAFGLKEDDKQ